MTTPPITITPKPGFRSHVKNISLQSSVFLLGTIFTTLASYFFKVYLAHYLGAEALGIYALGMTVVGLAGVLASAGLPQTATRFVAAYSAIGDSRKLGRFLWSALGLLLAANLFVGTMVLLLKSWIAQHLYHTPALAAYLYFFVIIMIGGALTTFLGQALAGYKDVTRRTIITSFIGQSLTMVCTIVLLAIGLGFEGYLVAQIASAFMVLILLGATVWQLTPPAARRPAIGLPLFEREVASLSLALFAVQGLEFGLAQTDKIVLGVYLHAREVGIYSIAAALVAFVSLALQSVNQIFSPTIAELHARGEMELLARLFRSLVKWTLGLTVPLAIVMILYARSIMGMFGWDFVSGWPVLAVGTIGQLVNCGVGSVGYLLLMSGHQQKWLRIQSVMAVALVILNLLLIPRVGMLGAAIAVATITSASNLLCLREVRRSLGIRPSLKKYYALMAPSVATLACVLTIRRLVNTPWPAWWMIGATLIVSYAVFIGSSLWFLDEDDRDIAKAVQSKLRAMVGGPTGTDR